MFRVWSDIDYAFPESAGAHARGAHDTLLALSAQVGEKTEGHWHREEELLDDTWIQQNRKKGQECGSEASTSHLEGLNWVILVVNEPFVNTFCLLGGKIAVFTGLLEHFRTDAEIATILGNEVGHAVARHSAE